MVSRASVFLALLVCLCIFNVEPNFVHLFYECRVPGVTVGMMRYQSNVKKTIFSVYQHVDHIATC